MAEKHCPGQDMRFWKPEDIFTAPCPFCRGEIEFWKDEPVRLCPTCRKEVRNPKHNAGCAQWCGQASECLQSPTDAASKEEAKEPSPDWKDAR
jgi:hypothetical protein